MQKRRLCSKEHIKRNLYLQKLNIFNCKTEKYFQMITLQKTQKYVKIKAAYNL